MTKIDSVPKMMKLATTFLFCLLLTGLRASAFDWTYSTNLFWTIGVVKRIHFTFLCIHGMMPL